MKSNQIISRDSLVVKLKVPCTDGSLWSAEETENFKIKEVYFKKERANNTSVGGEFTQRFIIIRIIFGTVICTPV